VGKIKKLAFKKHGKENLVLVALKEGAKSIGVELTKISDNQIVRERPVMRRSSLEVIREMRAGACGT
jgi:hypothetical protein